MITASIEDAGSTGQFLKIADHKGRVHYVQKSALCEITGSRKGMVFRLNMTLAKDYLIVAFETKQQRQQFLDKLLTYF